MDAICSDLTGPTQANSWLAILQTIRSLRASVSVKSVAFALHSYCGSKDYCWPSVKTLAASCGASTRTVQRAIKCLVESGLVCVEPRTRPNGSHTSNVYRFSLSPPPDKVTPPEDKSNSKNEIHASQGDGIEAKPKKQRYNIPLESFSKYATCWKHYRIAVKRKWIDSSEASMVDYLAMWARCSRLYREEKISNPAALMIWSLKNKLCSKIVSHIDETAATHALQHLRNAGIAV